MKDLEGIGEKNKSKNKKNKKNLSFVTCTFQYVNDINVFIH